MTNQEPGAPEPLTSLREAIHEVRAEFEAQRLAAHNRAEKWEKDREWDKESASRAVEYTFEEAIEKIDAALSHPESDTRGLDVVALRELVRDATGEGRGRLDSDDPDEYDRDVTANLAALNRILSASPDLSIDREGLTAAAEAMVEHFDALVTTRMLCDGQCKQSNALRAAIRGTTQPEPTE